MYVWDLSGDAIDLLAFTLANENIVHNEAVSSIEWLSDVSENDLVCFTLFLFGILA